MDSGPEIITTQAALETLEPYWDDLVSQMRAPSPFLRWDWVQRWVRQFQKQHRLAIGVLRDEHGRPIAIAPFAVSRGDSVLRSWLRHLSWIGGMGEVFGERMDLIVPAGRERELAPRLLRCIDATRGQWDAILLRCVPAESANLAPLQEALARIGTGCEEMESLPCRYTEVPADWQVYEGNHSGRWRRNLRKRWRVFADDHSGSRCLSKVDMPHGEALDHLARLHRLQFPNGESNFLRPAAWEFHRGLALEWLENGRALMPFLKAGDRVVAVAYGLLEGGQFSLYQQGWDPQFKHLSIGNLVVHWSMELASQRGLHTYDMLSGDSRYKAEWCPKLRHTVTLEAFPPDRLKAQSYRLVRSVRRKFGGWSQRRRIVETDPAEAGEPQVAITAAQCKGAL